MFLLEMKRRLCTKYVLFSILGILIITLGLNFIIVNDEKDIVSNLKGEVSYEGDITEENLFLALEKVRDEKSQDYYYESQIWIINSLVNSYPGVLYTESKISNYPNKYAKEFYDCWRNKFKTLLKRLPIEEQEAGMSKLNEVKTSFVQYPGYYIYSTAINNIQILFMIILFLVTFFASETYSDSFEDESMEIIKTTKAYKKNMIIRILPVIFYGILLTLIVTLGTVGIISSTVELKALKSSFKMISLFSFGNFSIGQAIMVMVLAEILGILALSTLMGYISLKTKKTTIAISLGVSLSIFFMVASKFKSLSINFIKLLLNSIPMASSQIPLSMTGFSLDFGIWEPYAIMVGVSITFILSVIALSIAINKKEVWK